MPRHNYYNINRLYRCIPGPDGRFRTPAVRFRTVEPSAPVTRHVTTAAAVLTGSAVIAIFPIMLSLTEIRARSGWMYLTAILAALYIGQTFPHEHCETGHNDGYSPDHNAPVAHAHHSHSHDPEPADGREPAGPAHHHDLARHVDSYFLRTLSPVKTVDPESALQLTQQYPDFRDEMTGAAVDVYGDCVPDTAPVFPLDARAPPARG